MIINQKNVILTYGRATEVFVACAGHGGQSIGVLKIPLDLLRCVVQPRQLGPTGCRASVHLRLGLRLPSCPSHGRLGPVTHFSCIFSPPSDRPRCARPTVSLFVGLPAHSLSLLFASPFTRALCISSLGPFNQHDFYNGRWLISHCWGLPTTPPPPPLLEYRWPWSIRFSWPCLSLLGFPHDRKWKGPGLLFGRLPGEVAF